MTEIGQSIQAVIDTIVAAMPPNPGDETVDTIKAGDPGQAITGIVTTFLATSAVIRRAVELGANLVITHEPTFYNHQDATDWLQDDPVYKVKRDLIDHHHVVIWRFHDGWHRHRPDGIATGVLKALGWEQYAADGRPDLCTLPPTPLRELVDEVKTQLQIPTVRVTGDPETICRRVGLRVGAPGGRAQIGTMRREELDVLICGEINEWETCEYVRDAAAAGQQRALVVLGHANSEEAGMKWLAEWLRQRLPELAVTHVPAGDPLRTM